MPRDYPARNGLARGSVITAGSPVGSPCLSHHYTSDEESVSTDNAISEKSLRRRRGGRGNQSSRSGSDSNGTSTPGGRWKKKDGLSSKIQIPEFGGKKGHPHEVHASATTTPLMRKVCPLIMPSLRSHFAGGMVAEGIKVAGVVVIPMGLLPPEGGGRKRMGSLVRSRSQNLGARRVILTM